MEFHLVDAALWRPQSCICGSTTGPFVDTAVELYDQHRVYLCSLCSKEVARTAGWMSPEDTETLIGDRDDAWAEVKRLKAELDNAADMRVVSLDEVRAELAAKGKRAS